MKYYLLCVLFAGFLFPRPESSVNEIRKISVNVSESSVRWDGYKVLGSHHGSVEIKTGELLFDQDRLIGGRFVVDMLSITVEDLEGDSRTRLENHLKSDDFFGVEAFPSAEFEIVRVNAVNDKGLHNIEGNLTIKENTHTLAFEANVIRRGAAVVADAKMVIDRSKYDVKYRSGSFFSNLGDRAIYDNFDLTVRLVAEDPGVN